MVRADADGDGACGRRSGDARSAGRGQRELAAASGGGSRDRRAEPGAGIRGHAVGRVAPRASGGSAAAHGGDRRHGAGAAGPLGGGVGERSGVVARGGVRADGDGGQPGRRCLGDDAALLPLGGRVDHDVGRGGGHGCGGRAGGGGPSAGVADAERAGGGGHVLLRRVRGRGGGGDEHVEQLLGVGGGEGDGAAARPDLAVAATPSDAELDPGESFTLSATVRNRGGAGAQATTLRYYRSADASITAGDAEVGTDAVAALAAGATSAESLTVNAPTAPGTYYYGACADAVAEETNTSNNCSAAVAVKVTEPPRPPDLVVTAASASEAESVARGGVRSDGDGGQPGRDGCVGDDAALLPLGGRVDHGGGRGGGHGCGGRAGGGGDQRRVTDGERADGAGHVLLRRVRGRGGGGDEHLEQLLGGGGGEGDGAAAAAGPGGDGGVGERSGVVARGGVRADGDGGQPGRRCLGDDAALLPLGGRVDHGGGRGGGHGCGGRAGGGGDQRRVTDAERADGAGHVLLRRVRGRGGGGDEHLEQLLGGGGGEGDGAAAAAGPGGDGGAASDAELDPGESFTLSATVRNRGGAQPRRRRCATTARRTRRSRRGTRRSGRMRWPRWRRGRPAPSH